ncbi:murein L,D-transpeptidase YafK [Hoeflea marina]|uniref:Murein L,D-transpeptidase YafK n=1 Tax=Hoeflea marina TaxID=274592 RepID=A0A317PFK8_9HYPH|nr:murein L,D-transpeptidase family protein [Hoeflea marina]PWV98126.1 murein L,D-transpeptidase YafK [Hoeflea marina]
MTPLRSLLIVPVVLFGLSGCQDALESVGDKVEHPLPAKLVNKMKANDMSTRSPIMMRIFKEEGVLEVWKQKGNGRYDRVAEYQICKWSGKLGPKIKEGDRQAPEGYYRIYPSQMNPKSNYYLSFNIGYPNSYDRSYGRTGSNLMVHGACSSAGCYSMTDEQVLEIYAFARDAFRGGQEYFLVEALPFRMTPENMARHRNDENYEFWKMLKTGYDQFELTKRPPKVDVCDQRYVFNQQTESPDAKFAASSACPPMSTPPSLAMAYQAYETSWNAQFLKAVEKVDKEEAKRLAAAEAKAKAEEKRAEAEAARVARAEAAAASPSPIASLFALPGQSNAAAATAAADPGQLQESAPSAVSANAAVSADAPVPAVSDIPVPVANPLEQADAAVAVASPAPAQAPPPQGMKPFWKLWSK